MELLFLTVENILRFHQDQIERYGGNANVRDMGLLESAAAMPMASFGSHYIAHDIYEMAAAYLFYIVMNHPFVDGNKRTGAVSAYIFLRINGIVLTAAEDEFADLALQVASGKKGKEDVVSFLRINCIAIEDSDCI